MGILTRSEQDTVMTRGLASVMLMIVGAIIFLGWISVKVTLKEILEVFNSLIVKVALTVANIILDVLFGKRIEEMIFASLSSSSFS